MSEEVLQSLHLIAAPKFDQLLGHSSFNMTEHGPDIAKQIQESSYNVRSILARAADEGELRARLRSPAMPPRCKACAFIKGTPANNTLETVLDALGCTIEDVPFMCHQHFDDAGRLSHQIFWFASPSPAR